MPFKHRRSAVSLAVAGLACGACQSSKIAQFETNHELAWSDSVVVEPFDMSRVQWLGDHGEHRREDLLARFSASLIRELNDRGLSARTVSAGGTAADALVLRGSVDLCDAGSGFSRAFWGFGAGQSKFAGVAFVCGPTDSPASPALVLHFEGGTHGKSGLQVAGYPCLVDADDAAKEIADFVLKHRPEQPRP